MVTIGSRIRVWWTEEEAWFAGRVVSSKRGGVHSVAYDDGVKVTHNLQKEKWEAEQELKRKAPAKADAPTLAKRKKGPPAQEQAADAPPPPKRAYAVGQHLEAKYRAQEVGTFAAKWFSGVVRNVHDDGAVDVVFS